MGSCFSDTAGSQHAVGGYNENRNDEINSAQAVLAMNGTRGLASHVELSISASRLRDRDLTSKSDPLVVLYIKNKNGSLEELGRSEVVLNSLEPKWVTKLPVLYHFEEVEVLLFRIYDVDTAFNSIPTKSIPLQQQQFLGEMECALSHIVTAPGQVLTRSLESQKDRRPGMPDLGTITVRAEEMVHSKKIVDIKVHCSDLDNKDTFSKSDPFLCINRKASDGSFISVYKTEVKRNTLNPTWKPIKITLQQLCNGEVECPLRIECFNYNNNGRHDLIGAAQTTLADIQTHDLPTLSLERQSSGHSTIKVGGKIHFQQCSVSNHHSFLDYIFTGFELNFLVAIDFTASNGNPFQRDSLHYIDPTGRFNAYQAAIWSVGEVLEFYDSDKRFTVWGFGGRPRQDQPVSHCFPLNGSLQEVVGIRGIMDAYSLAIRDVYLAGPTIFGPVINQAASIARRASQNHERRYFVLLIITDGVITDLQESVNALVEASGLPLSVLIVGVGGADFTEMEYLDADRGKLQTSDRSKVAVRDIVQFVPFRNTTGAVSLAQMLLAELPGQFTEYMRIFNIFPSPAS